MNSSPKIKLSNNLSPITSSNKINSYDPFMGGKKKFINHSNRHDNVIFDSKETDTVEHIDRLMNYYSRLSDHERTYNHSPDLYDFYNRERVSPLQKYSSKVRHLDISPDNPYIQCKHLFI
jgi:hypothetical protein